MNVSVKTWQRGEDSSWLLSVFDEHNISTKGINYRPDFGSSVYHHVRRSVLDSYSLVYRDGALFAGGGTRPDVYVAELGMCYQIMVRGFRMPQPALRQDYFTLDTLVPYQVARGRALGFNEIIMTFNEHNLRLKDNLDAKWQFKRNSVGPFIVNGVLQWIYLF